MALGRHRALKVAAIVVLVLLVGIVLVAWARLSRERPAETFASPEERFLYGSLGSEGEDGIPYWIWVLLPRMFPEHLGPNGLRSLGIAWQEGHELPAGFTKRVVGYPRVGNNCAFCHTATYRTRENETPRFVPGGPAVTTNVQAYLRFLGQCAEDPRFNSADVLSWIDQVYGLSFFDKLLYKRFVIPRARKRLLELRDRLAWMERAGATPWGPGRADYDLVKYHLAGRPVDEGVGLADTSALWNLGARRGELFYWDGSAPSLRTAVIDSARLLGARPSHHEFDGHVQWLADWLKSLPPPKYPLPVDEKLAASGKGVFDRECASCHAAGQGSRLGTVIDVAEIGTDRSRLDAWTQDAAAAANQAADKAGAKSRTGLQKTAGYVAAPLDGIWLRAPYLHNGSVPSLRDLLEPPARRPTAFYRGYDVYDGDRVGFVSAGPAAERFFRYETGARGNGKDGHVYGTTLAAPDKSSLLEYLKTL